MLWYNREQCKRQRWGKRWLKGTAHFFFMWEPQVNSLVPHGLPWCAGSDHSPPLGASPKTKQKGKGKLLINIYKSKNYFIWILRSNFCPQQRHTLNLYVSIISQGCEVFIFITNEQKWQSSLFHVNNSGGIYTPWDIQSLLLAQSSWITPSSVQGTVWGSRNEISIGQINTRQVLWSWPSTKVLIISGPLFSYITLCICQMKLHPWGRFRKYFMGKRKSANYFCTGHNFQLNEPFLSFFF